MSERTVFFSLFPTRLGDCGIAWRGDTVVATHLPEETSGATAARLTKRTGAIRGEPPPTIGEAIGSIATLLEGAKIDLSFVTCDCSGIASFEAEVYDVTREIAAGQTLTYGDIALRLGDKRLARKVGTALGRNPFPIIVPCHRVIGANDKLTGFSANGGIATKLKLLSTEGARIGEPPGLFGDLPLAVKPAR